MEMERSLKFASIWLLNPMVAAISTRGSSEGLLGVMVVALLWAVTHRRMVLAGVLLGLAVHFKIYPFIYASSIVWYLESPSSTPKGSSSLTSRSSYLSQLKPFLNPARITLAVSSLVTFTVLNILMYSLYGQPFLQHTYLHHLTRIDHRHNFSPYSTLLYLSSSTPKSANPGSFLRVLKFESLAFIPQLGLSAVLIPLVLGRKDLPGTMLAQTWAFVGLNKVCTSQVSPSPPSWPLSPHADMPRVFPLVHHFSPLLPPLFFIYRQAKAWHRRGSIVGWSSGKSFFQEVMIAGIFIFSFT